MASYIILIIFGALVCYIISSEKKKQNKFGDNSRSVQGTIIDYETVKEKSTITKFPVVRFTTENGDIITKKSTEGFFSSRIKTGMKTTVIYNAPDPSEFITLQPKFKTMYVTVMLGGILFILTGLILSLNEMGVIHFFKK